MIIRINSSDISNLPVGEYRYKIRKLNTYIPVTLVIFNIKFQCRKITKNKRWGSLCGGANK